MSEFVVEVAGKDSIGYSGQTQECLAMSQEYAGYRFGSGDLSLGSLSHLFQRAVDKARQFNKTEDLSAIRVGAHDEIYQARPPVLVGMDVVSTYCYLLEAAEHCDEMTWGAGDPHVRFDEREVETKHG
jgi:uncharacterized protein (UPF0548 family)